MGGKKAAAKADRKAKKTRASGGSGGIATTAAIAVVLVASLVSILMPSSNDTSSDSSVWTAEDEAAAAVRVTEAGGLLDAMETAGATVHVPLEAGVVPRAGVGVFLAAPAKAGQSLLTIPIGQMLHSGHTEDEAGLAKTLLFETQGRPDSEVMRRYIAGLPADCPPNVVTWKGKDIKLVKASLHSWKAKMVSDGRKSLKNELPDTTPEERDWAICMVLSRSLRALHGQGAVMIPFLDLFNHHPNASVYMASHPDRMVVVAIRNLAAGEELTWEYQASPSRARLLTSFGFGSHRDAPAASLASKDLPARDAAWMAEQNCPTVPRTDIEVNGDGLVDDADLRRAIRCIRLRYYSPEEAEWALGNGHLDAAWEGPTVSAEDGMLHAVMEKDISIIASTGQLCQSVLPQSQYEMENLIGLIDKASPALQEAVRHETAALMGCSLLFEKTYGVLAGRLKKYLS